MEKTKIRLGGIYYQRREYCAPCFQWRENEDVWVKLLPDGITLAVYNLNKNLICQTKDVCYPHNLNYEKVGDHFLIIEDDAWKKSRQFVESLYVTGTFRLPEHPIQAI